MTINIYSILEGKNYCILEQFKSVMVKVTFATGLYAPGQKSSVALLTARCSPPSLSSVSYSWNYSINGNWLFFSSLNIFPDELLITVW